MGERSDDVRLDRFALRKHEGDPISDPAGLSYEVRSVTGADSALIGGGVVIGEERASRAEIERLRADMGRRLRTPKDR
jgi:hypothetical protein